MRSRGASSSTASGARGTGSASSPSPITTATTAPPPRTEGQTTSSTKQLAERMERALMALPEAQRVAFQLMRFEGLSAVDAAAVLDTTPNAVKLRAHRTDQALRLALKEGGVGGRR
ncbi:MAG: sigma factor-like helix-turn-helix DNA-binding protein [Polyangiaceae bacterium]